jgi:hypothetical protein
VKKAFGKIDIGSTPFATTSIWNGISTVGTLRFGHPTASSIVDGRGGASPSHRRGKRRVRQKTIFAKHFRLIWAVQSSHKNFFDFAVGQITSSFSPVPRSSEGRTRRHERGARDAMDANASQDEATCFADGEVVWFWHLDADAKFLRS